MRRQGAYSDEDKEFVRKNAVKMTVEEIAAKINRNPKSVKRFIRENGLDIRGPIEHQEFAVANLMKSEDWKLIKERYTEAEQNRCVHQYKEIIAQFENVVKYTEILQILDYLHLDVELNRLAMSNRDIVEGIETIKNTVRKLHKKSVMTEEQLKDLARLEDTIAQKEITLDKILNQTNALIKQKGEIEKRLKVTRDQRLARVEQSNKTLAGMMTDLLSDPNKMRKVGIEMEKQRIATEIEMVRLGDLHQYADGQPDFPILTADTVKDFVEE